MATENSPLQFFIPVFLKLFNGASARWQQSFVARLVTFESSQPNSMLRPLEICDSEAGCLTNPQAKSIRQVDGDVNARMADLLQVTQPFLPALPVQCMSLAFSFCQALLR